MYAMRRAYGRFGYSVMKRDHQSLLDTIVFISVSDWWR